MADTSSASLSNSKALSYTKHFFTVFENIMYILCLPYLSNTCITLVFSEMFTSKITF